MLHDWRKPRGEQIMSAKDRDLLTRELEKIATGAVKKGARMAGNAKLEKAVDAPGGTRKVREMAESLSVEQYREECFLEESPEVVLQRVCTFFSEEGRILEDSEREDSLHPKISGVVGAGFFGKNPAVLHAEIMEIREKGCVLCVTGGAKEGLIKQHTAQKAVQKLLRFLTA